MKWNHEQEPDDGQTRIKTRFLLFPRTTFVEGTKQKQTRWLETASWLEEYNLGWDYTFWHTKFWTSNG